MRAGETSKDWYGKAGMSLLGAMLIFYVRVEDASVDEGFRRVLMTRYVDMVPEGNDGVQDVAYSAGMFEALLHHIEGSYPSITGVVLVSDNGPHFSSHSMLFAMHELNKRLASKIFSGDRKVGAAPSHAHLLR